MRSQDIFSRVSGDRIGYFWRDVRTFSSSVYGDRIIYFQWEVRTFLAEFVGTESDTFDMMSGNVLPCSWLQIGIFLTRFQDISSQVCGYRIRYFQWEVRTFLAEFVETESDTFDMVSGNFLPRSRQQIWIFLTRCQDISSRVCGDRVRYFWRDVGTFLAVFVPAELGHLQLFLWQPNQVF